MCIFILMSILGSAQDCPFLDTKLAAAAKQKQWRFAFHPNHGHLGNQLFSFSAFRGISRFYGSPPGKSLTQIFAEQKTPAKEIDTAWVRKALNSAHNPTGTRNRLYRHTDSLVRELPKYHHGPHFPDDYQLTKQSMRRFNPKFTHLYDDLDPRFASANMSDPDTMPFIHGYYESWKYWCHMADEIKADVLGMLKPYVPTPAAAVAAAATSGKARSKGAVEVVAVHLRVGDKMSEVDECSYGISYIRSAMDWFKEYFDKRQNKGAGTGTGTGGRYSFLVFCGASPGRQKESVELCRALIPAEHADHVIMHDHTSADASTAVGDLATMAMTCDHAIITLGTYGWWGGYLVPGRWVDRYLS
jgi:hypothetical protein